MAYNTKNVNIVDYLGFIASKQGGVLIGNPIYDKYVLAEGDSWFHIGGNNGALKERNLLDAVNFNDKHTMLLNMALSGDTMARMSDSLNSPDFYKLLRNYQWDMILLSAGGNDLIDALTEKGGYKFKNTTLSVIQSNNSPANYRDFINVAHLNFFTQSVLSSFSKFLTEKSKSKYNRETPIVIHTYDYPTPRNAPAKLFRFRKGPWLSKAFIAKGVPNTNRYWEQISDHIFNALAQAITSLEGQNNFHVVNTPGTITRAAANVNGASNDWLNEIHPNSHGIVKLADKINQVISPLC